MTTESVLTWEMLAERAMNKADAIFTVSTDIISNAVTAYGPQAVDLMLTTVRIDNLQKLIYGSLILLIMAITLGIYIRILIKELRSVNGRWSCLDFNVICSGIVVIVFCAIVVTYPIITVLNVWTWIGVIEPKVWVAKQVINKITSTAVE